MPSFLPQRPQSSLRDGFPLANVEVTIALKDLLADGPSHRVVADVAQRLSEDLGTPVEIWLADYRQQSLQGVLSDEIIAVDGTLPGRAFAAQATLVLGDRTNVPLTTRGDRIGVLEASSVVDPSILEELAQSLAQTIRALGTATDVYEKRRRRRPMTVAAELQWALLPGQAYSDDDVTVAAMLEPAYSIAGDAYDWTREADTLTLAVLNGTGRGVPAAMATTLALGALRNARMAGVSLSDQAALADQAMYAHFSGSTFCSALLFEFDVRTGKVIVVDAGSPAAFRIRQGQVEPIKLEAQLPLGMFEETLYNSQEIELLPGERLVVVSDGVSGTRTGDGSDFGTTLLGGALRDARLLSAAETTRHITRLLSLENGDKGPEDDAVVVCVDWHPSL